MRIGIRRCAKGVYLLDVHEEGVRLYRQDGRDYQPLSPTGPLKLKPDRWYTVTIECREDRLTARVQDANDGANASDVSATDVTLSSGRVQLGVSTVATSADVYFDDVWVTPVAPAE